MPVQLSSCGIVFANGQHKCRIEELNEIYVWNASNWSPENGGRCCAFTVPNGTTSIRFEILSGGGPGGSSGGDSDHGTGEIGRAHV